MLRDFLITYMLRKLSNLVTNSLSSDAVAVSQKFGIKRDGEGSASETIPANYTVLIICLKYVHIKLYLQPQYQLL